LERAIEVATETVQAQICNVGYLIGNLPAFGPLAKRQRELARGFWGALCPLPVPPELGDPTPGGPEPGQCEGVPYILTVSYTPFNRFTCNFLAETTASVNLIGPVKNVRLFALDTTDCEGLEAWIRIVADHTAEQTQALVSQPGGNLRINNFQIVSLVRQDGLPDDCGDDLPDIPPPPPPPPPPQPPDTDRPVTPDGGGPDINLTFSPRIGPLFVGVGGVIIAPVSVRVSGPLIGVNAPITVPVNISLPDFSPTISFGGGQGGGEIPDPPSEVCCEPPAIPGDEIEGEEEEPVELPPTPKKQTLIGVRVLSSINQNRIQATQIFNGPDLPNLWVPRIGSVHFKIEVETADETIIETFTSDVDVKLTNQYVPVPAEGAVKGAFVVPMRGVTMSLIPVYRQSKK
jgi:hypothetical protein